MKRYHLMSLMYVMPLFLCIVLFLFVPLVAMIKASFQQDGGSGFSLNQYQIIFKNPSLLQAFQNSIVISLASSLIGLLLAMFAAYAVTHFSKRVQERMLIFANLTSNFSGIPLAFAFIVLLGNSGLFIILFHQIGWDALASFNLYSWVGLVLIYVYFQIPLAIMLLYPVYHGIQKEWREAATLLGASPVQFWLRIGLPFILPSLAGTFSILFANAMGAYATAFALTGTRYNLVAVRIGSLVSGDVFARPELGSALAVVLGLILVIAMLINEWMMRKIRRDIK